VTCSNCGKPLTGSWNSGRKQKYPYYHCPKNGCLYIRKEKLESCFLALLETLRPQHEVVALFQAIIVDVWKQKQGDAAAFKSKLEQRLSDLQGRKARLVDLYADAKIRQDDYEERMDALRQEVTTLDMEIHATKLEELNIEELLGFAGTVLSQPARLWFDSDCDQKQRLQKVLFPDGLRFDGKEFGTAVTSSLFSNLDTIVKEKTNLASPTGFEPVLPP
jgi:site-specific DNA recombinase